MTAPAPQIAVTSPVQPGCLVIVRGDMEALHDFADQLRENIERIVGHDKFLVVFFGDDSAANVLTLADAIQMLERITEGATDA